MRGASADSLARADRAPRRGGRGWRGRGADRRRPLRGLRGPAARAQPASGGDRRVHRRPRPRPTWSAGSSASKLDPASLDLVATAAGRRWAATRDLGRRARAPRRRRGRAGRGAAGQADALESELFAFERLVLGNPELRDALSDPARSVDGQAGLLQGPARRQGHPGHPPARRAGGDRHAPHGGSRARELPEGRRRAPQPARRHRPGRPRARRRRRAAAPGRPGRGSTTARCTSTSSSTPT